MTVRVEIPFEGEKDLFACYGHYAPVIYERVEVFHDRLALSAGRKLGSSRWASCRDCHYRTGHN